MKTERLDNVPNLGYNINIKLETIRLINQSNVFSWSNWKEGALYLYIKKQKK